MRTGRAPKPGLEELQRPDRLLEPRQWDAHRKAEVARNMFTPLVGTVAPMISGTTSGLNLWWGHQVWEKHARQ